MPKIKQSFLTIVIGLALAAGISYAATWTGPTANPPLNNTEAPLNVGTVSQAKSGNLAVGTSVIPTVSLNVGGASNFTGVSQFLSRAIFVDKVGIGTVNPRAKLDVAGNVRIANGTQCDGCFLVSDADGLASWTDIGLGSSGKDDSGSISSVEQLKVTNGTVRFIVFPKYRHDSRRITNVHIMWSGSSWPVSDLFKIYSFAYMRYDLKIDTDRQGFTVTLLKSDGSIYHYLDEQFYTFYYTIGYSE